MKKLQIYVDASVIGGCEDCEFAKDSLALWQLFITGEFTQLLSEHTLREIQSAPENVRRHLSEIPERNQIMLIDTPEADALAEAYLLHGIIGRGSQSDALHVAIATVGRADVLVSWNFKHIVNLGKIRLFNAVNMEEGYGWVEIRTPREVLNEKDI